MGLLVYEQVSPGVYEAFSTDGSFTNPITTVHHGRDGDTFEVKLYVGRTDGDTTGYNNIKVTPSSSIGPEDLDPEAVDATGWGVKLLLDTGSDPTESDWEGVTYGEHIDFDPVAEGSSGSTPMPFWYRIESPRGEGVSNKRTISLELQYEETV